MAVRCLWCNDDKHVTVLEVDTCVGQRGLAPTQYHETPCPGCLQGEPLVHDSNYGPRTNLCEWCLKEELLYRENIPAGTHYYIVSIGGCQSPLHTK